MGLASCSRVGHRRVKKSVMPKGVEHVLNNLLIPATMFVKKSVMPKGVEHLAEWCKIFALHGVKKSVMPKGVEHEEQLADRYTTVP